MGIEGRMRQNGQFALDIGEPINNRSIFRDEVSGEIIQLWRTPQDVSRQSKYNRYRVALRAGFRELMRRETPELFQVNRRQRTKTRPVRAYNLPKLVSAGLTTLTCGGGVTIKTGIHTVDALLQDLKLEAKVPQWSWQASVYSYVGLKLSIDPANQELTLTRVWPDHLYPMRDDNDDIEYIAQKTWMPLESVPGWEAVRIDSHVSTTQNATQIPYVSRRGHRGVDNGDWVEIGQDGFVLEERHYRGWIEYHLFAVAGDRVLCTVPLSVYSKELAKQPMHFTGMPDFAITLFPNVGLGDDIPVSDWDDLVDETIDFNVRATKNSRLVDRYSAPREMVPASHVKVDPVTGESQWGMGDSDVIIMRGSDPIKPELLQPNANFDAPKEDLDFARGMIGLMSSARHLVDPELVEDAESGVSLKLKMGPALAKVEPRRQAQTAALKTLLVNIVAGLEFASSVQEDETKDASDKLQFGAHRFKGAITKAIDDLTKEVVDATGDPLRKLGTQDGKVNIAALLPHVKHIDLDTGTELLDKQARAASAMFLSMEGDQKIHFADPDTTYTDAEGQEMVPGEQIGSNLTEPAPVPPPADLDDLQQAVDALFVAENAVGRDTFTVRLTPGLPQDHAEANDRVVEGTMSLKRLLVDYDGMTEQEAAEEMQLIADARASESTDNFGLEQLEPDPVEDAVMDPLDPDMVPDEPITPMDQIDVDNIKANQPQIPGPLPGQQQAQRFMLNMSGGVDATAARSFMLNMGQPKAKRGPGGSLEKSARPKAKPGVNDQNDQLGKSMQTRPRAM